MKPNEILLRTLVVCSCLPPGLQHFVPIDQSEELTNEEDIQWGEPLVSTDFELANSRMQGWSLEGEDYADGEYLGIHELEINEPPTPREKKLSTKGQRMILAGGRRLWPNGIIPYKLDQRFTKQDRAKIAHAILEIETQTCVRFVPSPKNVTSFVGIFLFDKPGCSAKLGYGGPEFGFHNVRLGKPCLYLHIILHELMHVVGIDHEHNRPDRDKYIQIHWDRVKPGLEYNYWKDAYIGDTFDAYCSLNSSKDELDTCSSGNVVVDYGTPYDFASIMHYPLNGFAVNKSYPEISIKNISIDFSRIAKNRLLSKLNIRHINTAYNCFKRNSSLYEYRNNEQDLNKDGIEWKKVKNNETVEESDDERENEATLEGQKSSQNQTRNRSGKKKKGEPSFEGSLENEKESGKELQNENNITAGNRSGGSTDIGNNSVERLLIKKENSGQNKNENNLTLNEGLNNKNLSIENNISEAINKRIKNESTSIEEKRKPDNMENSLIGENRKPKINEGFVKGEERKTNINESSINPLKKGIKSDINESSLTLLEKGIKNESNGNSITKEDSKTENNKNSTRKRVSGDGRQFVEKEIESQIESKESSGENGKGEEGSSIDFNGRLSKTDGNDLEQVVEKLLDMASDSSSEEDSHKHHEGKKKIDSFASSFKSRKLRCRSINNHRCIFPFVLKGVRFNGCTTAGGGEEYSCPIRIGLDGKPEEWEICSNKCRLSNVDAATLRSSLSRKDKTRRRSLLADSPNWPWPNKKSCRNADDKMCTFPYFFNGIRFDGCVRLPKNEIKIPDACQGKGKWHRCTGECKNMKLYDPFTGKQKIPEPTNEVDPITAPQKMPQPTNEFDPFTAPQNMPQPTNEFDPFTAPQNMPQPTNEFDPFTAPQNMPQPTNEFGPFTGQPKWTEPRKEFGPPNNPYNNFVPQNPYNPFF